jgi:hypothetical protein
VRLSLHANDTGEVGASGYEAVGDNSWAEVGEGGMSALLPRLISSR